MSNRTILNPEGLEIIPCNEIIGELEILNDRFTKCTVLSDVDMRKMTSLMYSMTLCESNGEPITLNQNNIIRYVNTPVLEIRSSLGFGLSVVNLINDMPTFNVSETEIILFKTPVEEHIEGNKVKLSSMYHLMVGTGKGRYGSGGTRLTNDNLFMIRDESVSIIGAPSSSTELYNISTSDINIYNNSPHLALNNAGGVFSIVEGNNYYFKLSYVNLLPVFGAPTPYKVYRFIGPAGDYGAGGTNMASLSDFIFLQEDKVEAEQNVKVREIIIPEVIIGDVDINYIINTGPWDTINILENELVSFEVRKKIDLSDSMDVVLEKYFWKNGKGVIRRDTLSDDYLLYEKRTIVNLDGTGGVKPPPMTGIEGDPGNPLEAVNNYPGTLIQDSNEKSYIMIFNNTVDIKTSSVNVYEFTGPAGTYGAGNLQATPSDFRLVADDKSEIEPLKGIEGGANVTVDNTDPARPKISFTGGGGTVNSINGIFPDEQGEITLPLPEPTQEFNYKELVIGDWNIRSTQSKSLRHELPPNKWKSVVDVHVRIRNDGDTVYHVLSGEITIKLDSNNLNLEVAKDSGLANINYSQLSYNRGWVTIVYK